MTAPSFRVIPHQTQRAVWTQAYENDLPDACFAYIEPGGKKDASGKTVPRTLRHLPYKDKDGKVDLPHLRNALARLPQTNIPAAAKAKAQAKLEAAAKANGVGNRIAAALERRSAKLTASEAQRSVTTFAVPPAPQAVKSAPSVPMLPADGIYRIGIPATIRIVDETRREIEVCATSEAVDSYDTIFSYEASKDAFSRWVGNVREMHQPIAAGSGIEVRCDDATRKIYVRLFISQGAESTWLKVKDGTLRGASIGASKVTWQVQRVNGQERQVATRYDLVELSLVDNASNRDAMGITFIRSGQPDTHVLAAAQEDQRMPDAPTAAPQAAPVVSTEPFDPLTFGLTSPQHPLAQRMAREAEDREVRIAGERALQGFPPWNRDTEDFNGYLARRAAVKGSAEAQKRMELRQSQARRATQPTTPAPIPAVPATPAVPDAAASAAPTTPETTRDGVGDVPAMPGNAPQVEAHHDEMTPVAHQHAHSHVDGTKHSHLHYHGYDHHDEAGRAASAEHEEHAHVYRQGIPFDARLEEGEITRFLAANIQRLQGESDDPFSTESLDHPQSGSVLDPNNKPSTPLETVNPQKVGQRDLINSEDANAKDFGVPEPAEERPTPDVEALDTSAFHDGGHQMLVPWTDGSLDNDGDIREPEDDTPRAADEPPPTPTKITMGKPTPGNADGRAAQPDTARVGASISAPNRAKIHAMRDDNLKNAANAMDLCQCDDCQGLASALAELLGDEDEDANMDRSLVAKITRQQTALLTRLNHHWSTAFQTLAGQVRDLELTIQDATRQQQATTRRAAERQANSLQGTMTEIVQRVEAAALEQARGLERRLAIVESQPVGGGPAVSTAEKRLALSPETGQPSVNQEIAALQKAALASTDVGFRSQIAAQILRLQQEAKGQPLAPIPNFGALPR